MRILLLTISMAAISCGQNQTATDSATLAGDTTAATLAEDKIFDYPVLYSSWKIGDHEHTRKVLQVYKAWDKNAVNDLKELMADSVILDLPNGVRRAGTKEEVIAGLVKSREQYAVAVNDVLAAYPLINSSNDEPWVNVLVYNKWSYKDNRRDSMLYMDLWKFKEGKINYLLSLEQTPSRLGLKRLENLTSSK